MKQYLELVEKVFVRGEIEEGRNGKTRATFGEQITVGPIYKTFPILTQRKMFPEGVIGELAAFLQGPGNLADFRKQGCNYWDQWADADGNLKVDYGNAWRDFAGVNQLQQVVNQLIYEPNSRRHLIIGWNPPNDESLSLPCCHYAYQWRVVNKKWLDMIWVQRSADMMIGVPSDIIAGALFNILMARTTGYIPRYLTLQLGNCHIYQEHWPRIREFLNSPSFPEPEWYINPTATVFNFKPTDFSLIDYQHGPSMPFELKV